MNPLTSWRVRALPLLLLALLFIFTSQVNAQNNAANAPAAQPPAAQANDQTNTDTAASNQDTATSATDATQTITQAPPSNQQTQTSQSDQSSPTAATSASQTTSTSAAAAPASAATATADSGNPLYTDAPSLQGVGIPPLIVPDTSGAPFMQAETVPEGTVFIAVGAILAFIGTSVLAWRGLVAWSLHRSVKYAANHQYPTDNKPLFGGPPRGYTSMYADSNVSLEHLAAQNTAYSGAAGTRRSTQNKKSKTSRRPESTQPASSLFFSPTAGAAGQNAALRTSSYLPAGFYASGTAAPAAGQPVAHVGGSARTSTYGHLASNAASPPQSPAYPAPRSGRTSQPGSALNSAYTSRPASRERLENPRARRGHAQGQSESTMSLGAPPQGRAPSAYLDDLFENHGNGPRERF